MYNLKRIATFAAYSIRDSKKMNLNKECSVDVIFFTSDEFQVVYRLRKHCCNFE